MRAPALNELFETDRRVIPAISFLDEAAPAQTQCRRLGGLREQTPHRVSEIARLVTP
jgi:hypothetical protein